MKIKYVWIMLLAIFLCGCGTIDESGGESKIVMGPAESSVYQINEAGELEVKPIAKTIADTAGMFGPFGEIGGALAAGLLGVWAMHRNRKLKASKARLAKSLTKSVDTALAHTADEGVVKRKIIDQQRTDGTRKEVIETLDGSS